MDRFKIILKKPVPPASIGSDNPPTQEKTERVNNLPSISIFNPTGMTGFNPTGMTGFNGGDSTAGYYGTTIGTTGTRGNFFQRIAEKLGEIWDDKEIWLGGAFLGLLIAGCISFIIFGITMDAHEKRVAKKQGQKISVVIPIGSRTYIDMNRVNIKQLMATLIQYGREEGYFEGQLDAILKDN
jgi:hypothetical protein